MKSLQIRTPGGFDNVCLIDRPAPAASTSRVTVAMHAVGLCRTDVRVARGELAAPDGLVLGHEGAGTVIHDPTGRFEAGDRVAVNPYLPGGRFLGLHVDGLLQEQVQLPAEQLVSAHNLAFHVAAYVEPVAASMAVLKALPARARSQERGLLLGSNRIAHLTYLVLCSNGFQVDWVKAAAYEGAPNQYDFAVETLFEAAAIHSLMGALKPSGLLVVKSRQFTPTAIVPSLMVEKELTLKAVNYGDFDTAMTWLSNHQDAVAPLLGERYALADWRSAFEAASAPQAAKLFIEM